MLGNDESAVDESFEQTGILDFPQWTRPADFRGWAVPEVLQNGNHADIRRWRAEAAKAKTSRNRPDLLKH